MNLQSESSNSQVYNFVKPTQDYYQCNMANPQPLFVAFPPSRIMGSRHRKHLKLQAQKEQSLARKRQAEPYEQKTGGENEKENILQHLSQENLSDLEKDSEASAQSYDEDVHDIYNTNDLQSKFRFVYSSNGPEESILDTKKMKESQLIIDFKRTNKNLMNTRNMNLDQQRMQHPLKNQLGQKSPYLNIASPDQKKEKKTSFIGYYNSLEKKQPSKILERYIKDKK